MEFSPLITPTLYYWFFTILLLIIHQRSSTRMTTRVSTLRMPTLYLIPPYLPRPLRKSERSTKQRQEPPIPYKGYHDGWAHSTLPRSRRNNLSSSYIPQGSLMPAPMTTKQAIRFTLYILPFHYQRMSEEEPSFHGGSRIVGGLKIISMPGKEQKLGEGWSMNTLSLRASFQSLF